MDRRSLLATCGSAIAGSKFMSNIAIAYNDNTNLNEKHLQLLEERKYDAAQELIEDSGVPYVSKEREVPAKNNLEFLFRDSLSPQDHLDKSGGRFIKTLYQDPENPDIYTVVINWRLHKDTGVTGAVDKPAPEDLVAIGWEDSQWSYEADSWNMQNTLIWNYSYGNEFSSNKISKKNVPYVGSGPSTVAACAVNDYFDCPGDGDPGGESDCDAYAPAADTVDGYFRLKLESESDDTSGDVAVKYSHTWVNNVSVIGSILGNVGLQGKGTAVSFDIPTGVYNWKVSDILEQRNAK